jgi:hypothetical protein
MKNKVTTALIICPYVCMGDYPVTIDLSIIYTLELKFTIYILSRESYIYTCYLFIITII